MKKLIVFIALVSIILINIPSISAQTAGGRSVRGQSMNGATGLFSIPSGHIGWEDAGNVALDVGYRTIINNDAGTAHIPAITLSLLKWVELSAAFDIQPDHHYMGKDENNDDLLFGLKIRLPTANTAIALGGNLQLINIGSENVNYNAYQPYMAITYRGDFFKMPAETTLVFGKTFYSGLPKNNSNIDFGMGFDLILFPDVFGNIVHWIIDFANFSYSDNAWVNSWPYHSGPAWYRGALNTGIRIDLSAIPALNKFKFLIDMVFNDLFDDGGRSFTIGAVFGFSSS
ncbi:MAG: hypothetical protein LBU66_06100 [Treponema sp.]|nr:hypothetical protein [Treponema sp.]